MTTMSGPPTRPADEAPEFEPVSLPRYSAQFYVERQGTGEHIVSVTIAGSPRIIDQIMQSVSDAFREEVET